MFQRLNRHMLESSPAASGEGGVPRSIHTPVFGLRGNLTPHSGDLNPLAVRRAAAAGEAASTPHPDSRRAHLKHFEVVLRFFQQVPDSEGHPLLVPAAQTHKP